MEWTIPNRVVAAFAMALLSSAAAHASFPTWAYPGCAASVPPSAADQLTTEHIPGSALRLSKREIADWSVTRDWFPADHTPLPPVLAVSPSAETPACGYCHLPTGSGRVENANLTGLSASYIEAQLKAFRAGKRSPAMPDWAPSLFMATVAANLTPETAATAAEYFSHQQRRSFVKVVEATTVPGYDAGCFVFTPNGKSRVPLGSAIIEMPAVLDSFERRDPHAIYIAYVPPGSVARGRQLAERRVDALHPPCAVCHGANLRGAANAPAPALAGRFATYLFRQLLGFQSATRVSDPAEPMQSVVARLSERDMIDVSAYAASVRP